VNPPVLYEDADVLAVDKPEGIVSVSEAGKGGLPELLKPVFPGKLFPVHRLDREVSGVILFAKNAAAHRHLNMEFDRRAVRKTYLALVHGLPARERGTIDSPIREFGSGRMGVDPERGKPSSTEFERVEKLEGTTLLKAFPATGRRHQIRVHLFSIGHPVVGDLRYGDRSVQGRFPRLMLHALAVEFRSPGGKDLRIEAPVPATFSSVLESARRLE
jgi:tRNA pseudouridine32 synthase/23S rRNA pseudouridine746 synthase